jgi:GNAT superfamily N-acetyltransferase
MITTRFLSEKEYGWYADWLKGQDEETLRLFFGVPVTDFYLEHLTESFVNHPDNNYFLVAESRGLWVGTVHIAVVNETDIEFGVIVAHEHRNQGIADQLMQEAIVWARNRGYSNLYMHCLTWNRPIRHLAEKHGLAVKNFTDGQEVESRIKLPPPTLVSLGQEIAHKNRNLYRLILQSQEEIFASLYQ